MHAMMCSFVFCRFLKFVLQSKSQQLKNTCCDKTFITNNARDSLCSSWDFCCLQTNNHEWSCFHDIKTNEQTFTTATNENNFQRLQLRSLAGISLHCVITTTFYWITIHFLHHSLKMSSSNKCVKNKLKVFSFGNALFTKTFQSWLTCFC